MKKIIIFLFAAILIFPSVCFSAAPLSSGLADEIKKQSGTMGVNSQGTFQEVGLTETIAKVIKTFLGLLGIIFTVLMLLGGYTWMTAQGEEAKVEKAKNTIQSAVIGLIIVASTYSITYTIFKAL